MPTIPESHPRPASFGTEPAPTPKPACDECGCRGFHMDWCTEPSPTHPVGGPPLSGWIDEPTEIRLLLSSDDCPIPTIEFVGHGKRLHIGLDGSLGSGSAALRMLRVVVEAAERHEELTRRVARAAGMDAA